MIRDYYFVQDKTDAQLWQGRAGRVLAVMDGWSIRLAGLMNMK